MTALSQNARVLAALRRAGPSGITAAAFAGPYVCDGLAPILRVAARIQVLRDQGHHIDSTSRHGNLAIYKLVSDAESSASTGPSTKPAAGVALDATRDPGRDEYGHQLFGLDFDEVAPVPRRSSHYDPYQDAA